MFEFVDLIHIAVFAGVLFGVNKLVAIGAFDWVKIKFSYNGTKKEVTTDKLAWAKYGLVCDITAIILYSMYRIFYQ
jgi:hypothetical protein